MYCSPIWYHHQIPLVEPPNECVEWWYYQVYKSFKGWWCYLDDSFLAWRTSGNALGSVFAVRMSRGINWWISAFSRHWLYMCTTMILLLWCLCTFEWRIYLVVTQCQCCDWVLKDWVPGDRMSGRLIAQETECPETNSLRRLSVGETECPERLSARGDQMLDSD